jgi:hypothetical protein
MRVTVPRRFIWLGTLLALLCLVPAITSPVFAKPFSWTDNNDPNPPAPKGDGDGTVVKVTGGAPGPTAAMATTGTRTSVQSTVGLVLQVLRLGYGWRWYL